MPLNRFQKAMRLINLENKSHELSSILSGIKKFSKLLTNVPPSSWPELQRLGTELKRVIGSQAALPIVQNIKAVSLGMIPEVERMTMKQPDLFTEVEDQERKVNEALPPDFLSEGEVVEEQGYLDEPPVVTAAKKPPSPINVLRDIAGHCDAALSFRPESSAKRLDIIRRYYENGKEGLGWYDNVNSLLNKYFGKDNAKTFARLLAATSPRMPVERNLTTAIQAFNQYVNEFKSRNRLSTDKDVSLGDDPNFRGRMANYFMKSHVPNIGRAMSGRDLSGSKVDNFQKALSGDGDAVTLDVWMGRALGIRGNLFDDPNSYQVISDAIREMAAEAGVEPRQYQAAVWTGIKKEQGNKGQTASSFDALMNRFWDDFAHKCFKPNVKIPKATSRYPLLEGVASWVDRNCRFATR